jgi:hypothetical protein
VAGPIAAHRYNFADGNAGHVVDLGSAPSAGQWDILCVNSDTVVSTPAGFTSSASAVNNQGAYVFTRKAAGSEGQTVTITTSGNFPAAVVHTRWSSVLAAVDVTGAARIDASIGNVTAPVTTGALAADGETVVAFGALHSIGVADQSAPVWDGGLTAVDFGAGDTGPALQGSGASGAAGFVGYKETAGSAGVTTSVTWTGASTFDRYTLVVTFTISGVTGTAAGVLGALVGAATGTRTVLGAAAGALGALMGQAVSGVAFGSDAPIVSRTPNTVIRQQTLGALL